jgi:uncharacterized protein
MSFVGSHEQPHSPRLLPDEPFPAYAFVPGHFPHPISDPQGHSFGHRPTPVEPLDSHNWQASPVYARAIDLFNHGYYWEAHEAWESLWHACGKTGAQADFLKGLIRLAAAGVKVREGRQDGVSGHTAAAGSFFMRVANSPEGAGDCYCGLSLKDLRSNAEQASSMPVRERHGSLPAVEIVFPFVLRPSPCAGESR